MAARKLNRESWVGSGLAPVRGPLPTSRLGGEMLDEAALLDAYDAHLRLLENRSPATANTYLRHVRAFFRHRAIAHPSVDLRDVTKLQVRAWLLHEANRGIAPVTRSTSLYALRSFYRFLIAEDLAETNPAAEVTLPSPPQSRIEYYNDTEADAVIGWASAQPGLRWQVRRVVLDTLWYTGLRLDELVSLRTDEVDLGARRISFTGKGRKHRLVPVPYPLVPVLGEYLEDVRPRLPASPYLFANPQGARNRGLYGRYGPRSVYALVVQAGTSAGVGGRHFPHRWRHSYATCLIRRGVDIHVVQRLMGHSNISTTRYVHLSDDDLRAAVDRAYPAA